MRGRERPPGGNVVVLSSAKAALSVLVVVGALGLAVGLGEGWGGGQGRCFPRGSVWVGVKG